MSRIFLSHSSANNAETVALRDWLADQGWKDEIFVDFDPQSGIAAGERWERALNVAANRCEAVVFLVSKQWLASRWCLKEFYLAHQLNKRLFGVLIEEVPVEDLPRELAGTWQIVQLAAGRDQVTLRGMLPVTQELTTVSFSAEGLARLKRGLEGAGLDPKYFAWPPPNDPERPPYRGLRPLEAEDTGIFFGRDAPIVEALDALRGLRDRAPPRILVILGASGAGKSSCLRAGLFPRLARDDRNFFPLPIIRPGRAAISGEAGLLRSLEVAFETAGIALSHADLLTAVQAGAAGLRPLLQAFAEKVMPPTLDTDIKSQTPALILSVDQAEELEMQGEALPFLALLRELLLLVSPVIIAVFTIRSDNYERLQLGEEMEGVRQKLLSLPPMPKGSYAEVIKGPARRLQSSERPLGIEEGLVDALLADIETGSAKDALPLLAFTLERLYSEYHASGHLRLSHYYDLGGVKGSIEAAVERALEAADADSTIPKTRVVRLALLRRGLIPWLAGIDPDTGTPRRRIARLSEIPIDARPLIGCLVEQRLLATDVTKAGETTIEPAHEALLRQWSLLQTWLAEDTGLLGVLESVRRASREWAATDRSPAWLAHSANRLAAAERLRERPDLAASLEPRDHDYISACRKAELAAAARRRLIGTLVYMLLLGIIGGLLLWINQDYVKERINWFWTMRPYMLANFTPHVLTAAMEAKLKSAETFRECAKDCPQMIVIPPGAFTMGSAENEPGRAKNEGPRHQVTIAKAFALSVYDVTFDEWDACVAVGGCRSVKDSFGRGRRPVTNVTWDDAQGYVAWLSKMSGRSYRLPTEAEWEYAARAGTTTTFYWGDELGKRNANCIKCGTQWDNAKTSPVGSFKPNPFGLYDMTGNAWQWVADCFHNSYKGTLADGSAYTEEECGLRSDRGGSWISQLPNLRIAFRGSYPAGSRNYSLGLRVARTLAP